MSDQRQTVTSPPYTPIKAEPGKCYANAIDFLFANRDSGVEWDLVHGIPLGTGGDAEGRRYGHAWCEAEHDGIRWAYDPTTGVIVPAGLYRHLGSISYAVVYSYAEWREHALRTGHSGPWDRRVKRAYHE